MQQRKDKEISRALDPARNIIENEKTIGITLWWGYFGQLAAII